MEEKNNLQELSSGAEYEEISPKRGIFSLAPAKNLLHVPLQIFLLMLVCSVFYWSYPEGRYLSASGNTVYRNGEVWRLLSALFTHGDPAHLLANGWIFILFGWMLRVYFGTWAFPLLSFAAGIITNALTIFLYSPETGLIGASGMVHSMIAMWIVWYIAFNIERTPGQRLLRATGFSLAMLVPAAVKPGVSYLAHGIGFTVGLVIAFIAIYPARKRVNKIMKEVENSEEPVA